MTKAFGLWFGGIERLCGVTQWGGPALRLHGRFGDLEVLTAYTPAHSHPNTLTYRVRVDQDRWPEFFGAAKSRDFAATFAPAGFAVDPKCTESLKSFQRRLEANGPRYYLNADHVGSRAPDAALDVYKRTHIEGY